MKTKPYILSALFAALICVGAFIRIPLPIIPFSLQFLFVNLAGLLLGWKWGALSVILYVTIGLIGLPVFTGGGGISYILRPSFGYLLGFIPAAMMSGYISQRGTHVSRAWWGGIGAIVMMYLVALPYLYFILTCVMDMQIQIATLLSSYFLIFLPGDLLSVTLGWYLYQRLHHVYQS